MKYLTIDVMILGPEDVREEYREGFDPAGVNYCFDYLSPIEPAMLYTAQLILYVDVKGKPRILKNRYGSHQ